MAMTNFAGRADNLFSEVVVLESKISSDKHVRNPKFFDDALRLKTECHRLHWDAHILDQNIRNARFRSTFNIQERDMEKRLYLLRNEIQSVKNRLNDYLTLEYNPPQCSSIFSSPSTGSSPGHPSTWSSKLPPHINQNSYTGSDYASQSQSQSHSQSQSQHPLSRPTLPVFLNFGCGSGPGFGWNNSQPQQNLSQGFASNPFNNMGTAATRMFNANTNAWFYGAAGARFN